MKALSRLALLSLLGPLAAACSGNRPIAVGVDGGASQAGGAGTISGTGGSPAQGGSGGAPAQGEAGGSPVQSGAGGSSGVGGVSPPGCDVNPIFGTNGLQGKYYCTVIGACHDAERSATGLDMTSADWAQKLVGTLPSDSPTQPLLPSMCLGTNEPYLIKGSYPARGLFLDKLKSPPPCGYVMPNIGGPITATDMECVQDWANALTTQ